MRRRTLIKPTTAERGGERRCIVEGARQATPALIRFVRAPDGSVVPDIDERLPGRGLWVGARRDLIARAVAEKRFQRAARDSLRVSEDLADRVEALLVRKAIDTLGFARRAGRLVTGFEKTAAALRAGQGVMVLAARDGAADGRRKIGALARECPLAGALTADELGRAVGRDHVVHAALTRAAGGRTNGRPDGLADSLSVSLGRLDGFRTISDGDLENATGGCMQTAQNAGAGDQRMEKAKHGGQ
ncbi:MAG: RNA-binding protein [Pseudomonadota bacterium]|nr:RNA-binding protein [Pseudomonadota bacterium]